MKHLLTLPFLFVCVTLSAQETFHRIVDADYASIQDVERDAAGNLYTSAYFVQNPLSGMQVVKHDPAGTMVWSFLLSTLSTSHFVKDMKVTPAGEVVIAGTRNGFGGPDSCFVIKLTTTGTVAWSKLFGADVPAVTETNGFGLAIAANGDILVGGQLTANAGNLQDDMFLARMDAGGTVLWTKRIVPPVQFSFNYFGDILPIDNGIILVGNVALITEGSWLMLLNNDGQYQWCRRYDTNGSDLFRPVRVFPTPTGYDIFYRTAFNTNGDLLQRISTNSNGFVSSSRRYGFNNSNGQMTNVIQRNDGSYVVSGRLIQANNSDGLLFNTDATGAVQWGMTYGSSGYEQFNAVATTQSGGLLAGGVGERDSLLFARGGLPSQSYLVMTNGTGDSFGCDAPFTVTSIAGNNTDVTYFQTLTDIGGWANATFQSTVVYSAEQVCLGVGINEANTVLLSTFPNPASEQISINGMGNAHWQHRLLDASGRSVRNFTTTSDRSTIDIRDLAPGLYLLHSTGLGKNATSRVIVAR